MAGNARSGRKNFEHEKIARRVLASADRIIDEALRGVGRWKDIPDEVILEIATRIFVKKMPQKLEGEVSHIVTMERVKVNGAPLEIEIG